MGKSHSSTFRKENRRMLSKGGKTYPGDGKPMTVCRLPIVLLARLSTVSHIPRTVDASSLAGAASMSCSMM